MSQVQLHKNNEDSGKESALFSGTYYYRVYFRDTDAGGIMYHARYVEVMEIGRSDLFRELGFSIRKLLEKNQTIFPVHDLSIRYLKPAYLDDLLHIQVVLHEIRGAKVFFSYQIYNETKVLLATARTTNAIVHADTLKPIRPSRLFLEQISGIKRQD